MLIEVQTWPITACDKREQYTKVQPQQRSEKVSLGYLLVLVPKSEAASGDAATTFGKPVHLGVLASWSANNQNDSDELISCILPTILL
jgi:hypothetical protein